MDIAAIIKEIASAGIGLGSLILFSFLFWTQMKILEKVTASQDKNTVSLDANTRVTEALAAKIEQSLQVDKQVIEAIAYCKNHGKS